MPASVSHVLSATTPDDPTFEIRPSHWNSLHALTLNLTGSEISNAFGNGGGVSFGLAGGVITAQAPAGAPSPIAFSAGTTTSNVTGLTFSDSNGISFGLGTGANVGVVTATVRTNYQSAGAYLTTARASNDAIGLATAQTNVTWTVNSNGLSLNAGGYAGTGFTSTTTAGTAVVGTQNTAGLSLGIPAYLTTAQSPGAYLTTARASNDAIGLATAQSNVTWTVNSAGLSLDARGYAGTGTTFNGANISGSITQNSVGLNLSLSVAPPGGGAQTAISGIIVSDATYTSGTVSFSNAGNITINSSVNGATQYIRLSGNAAQTVQSAIRGFGASNTGNTAGNTGISTGIDWVVAGSNNITISESTVGGGPNTLWVSGPTVGGAQTGISGIIVSDATYTSGTVSFSNAGNITISSSVNGATQFIRLSGNAAQSVVPGIQSIAFANTTFTTGAVSFSNANRVSFGSSGAQVTASIDARAGTDAVGLNTAQTNVTWTVNSAGLSLNASGYAGTGTTFNGANISGSITQNSVGLNLSLSVAAVGAAAANVNLLGANTSGNTTASGSTLGFSGLNLTLSGTNASQIVFSAPATSSLVGINGISISTAGSTISVLPQWISSYENFDPFANTVSMTWNGASVSHAVAFNMPSPISASFLRIPMLMTTNSTTIATMASATASASGGLFSTINAVVYSLGTGANSQSLQSVASGSAGYSFTQRISVTNSTQASYSLGITANANGAQTNQTTQYSVSNTNYSFTTNQIGTAWSSARFLDIPFASSLSPGPYWVVIGMSSSTGSAGAAGLAALTNCNVRYSQHYGANQADIAFGVMGSTNLTSGGLLGAGSFSTAGGGTTNSLAISLISSSAFHARPYFQLLRSA